MAISRVAVIGAGPCGLAALKYLLAEKTFSLVQAFEQRDTVGGVWAYNTLSREGHFAIPRTRPTPRTDEPIRVADKDAPQFVSAIYDDLDTNIPHTLMAYGDKPFPAGSSLFPSHQAVKQYLDEYADEVRQHISFSTQVTSISRAEGADGARQWEIDTLDLQSQTQQKARFDAVFVASGHYSDPYIPDIPGLAEFESSYPGSITHSKFYRNPDDYAGKKVVVVGNSASGIDLSAQIQTTSQHPVLISERSPQGTGADEQSAWAKLVPEISEVVAAGRKVRFADGHVEEGVDAIVFCTGYHYGFPFLRGLSPPIVTDGSRACSLYQHLLYTDDPTLAIAGIPQRIVPFPFGEAQAGWISRVWSGRLELPSGDEMRQWEVDRLAETGGGGRAFHVMPFPQDVDYINRLHGLCARAERKLGLEGDGVGKMPPFWDAYKRWLRQKTPLVKAASRKLGERRRKLRTLEELGFDYNAEKASQL